MRILNRSGIEIPENIVDDIVVELFKKINNNFESKKELPKRIDLISFVYGEYREKYRLDLICAGHIEEKMELIYGKELKEMGYILLNKYNPDWYK